MNEDESTFRYAVIRGIYGEVSGQNSLCSIGKPPYNCVYTDKIPFVRVLQTRTKISYGFTNYVLMKIIKCTRITI